ncbi:hypothetical protein CSOJ01_03850 [Colletotrichum sojae]|uniref:Uncharacterized protein n=1 Tax=Colletotrichum sojae TaxID=2175907 RepID=A0A8H6JKD9_9PEZI|nr:hypothetical protein CSOJ01_03850 [Colletotrichum sojae]
MSSPYHKPGLQAFFNDFDLSHTGTVSSPFYKPGLPAFYNDFDLRHLNGASVVFGAGGQVQCIKLAKDFSAIRMDGLGPHQLNPVWVKSALKKLGISEVAKFGPRFDDDTYTQYMVVVAEDPHFAQTALARLQGLTPRQHLEPGLLYVRLNETRLGLDDIDPIMPPALTSPICRLNPGYSEDPGSVHATIKMYLAAFDVDFVWKMRPVEELGRLGIGIAVLRDGMSAINRVAMEVHQALEAHAAQLRRDRQEASDA